MKKVTLSIIIILMTSMLYSGEKVSKYIKRGNEYCDKGDYVAGIVEYKKALQIDNNNPAVHNNIALAYYRNGSHNDAVLELENGYTLLSDLQEYFEVLSSVAIFSREKKIKTKSCETCDDGIRKSISIAIEHLEKAKMIKPEMPEPWYNLGMIYHKQKKYKMALSNLLYVEKIYNSDKTFLYYLSAIYAALGKHETAINKLEQAIEHGFDDSDLLIINPDFKKLQATKRFKELIDKISEDTL